jgi:aquaporin Z
LMSVVLFVINSDHAKYTGLFAGVLVATFITFEAPLSGMSMNPARSLASAIPSQQWMAFWIYLTAPVLGMQLAAAVHRAKRPNVACAKLMHSSSQRCIHCGYTPEKRRATNTYFSGVMS